ncbi:MAG: hypothetical protein R3A45_03550 [Bdellovibrionota bacterium]
MHKCVLCDVLHHRDQYSKWAKQVPLSQRRKSTYLRPLPTDIKIDIPIHEVDMVHMDRHGMQQCTYQTKPWQRKNCVVLGYKQEVDLLMAREDPVVRDNYDTYAITYGIVEQVSPVRETHATLTGSTANMNLLVEENETVFLHMEPAKLPRKIVIQRKDALSSKVVISGVIHAQDMITAELLGKPFSPNTIEPVSRYDGNLLTGCITLYDATLEGGTIFIRDVNCEDALNIFRSSGTLDQIKIRSAAFDALDIDYSRLHLKNIDVVSSGNDCVDLSAGDYTVDTLSLQNCGDKGLSVGERATVKVHQIKVTDALDGVVSKDQSLVEVERFIGRSNKATLFICIPKKQEFGPAVLKVQDKQCQGKNYRGDGSQIQ